MTKDTFLDKNYLNFLQNKKVIIIGPAKYTTSSVFKDFGKKIDDNFDIVVRINRGLELLPKLGNFLGTRTDILYNCLIEHKDNGGEIDINYLKNNNIKWISTIPGSDIKGNCNSNKLHNLVKKSTVKTIQDNFNYHLMHYKLYDELNKSVKCRSNTGFAAIFDLLNHNVGSLYITGFSFYLDSFADGYKHGCSRDEIEFAKQCFKSKRHNQLNQWRFAQSKLKNNPRVLLDEILTYILDSKTLDRDAFREKIKKLSCR